MSRLTDDELSSLYYKGYASKLPEKGCHRAALRAVADATVAAYVPDELKHTKATLTEYDHGYIQGFNACRAEILKEPK